jgi:hypothetical protein
MGGWERKPTYCTGISIAGSSVVKYAVPKAAVAVNLLIGSKYNNPSAKSKAAGVSHLRTFDQLYPEALNWKRWTHFVKYSRNLDGRISFGFTSSYHGKSLTPGQSLSLGVPITLYITSN